MRAATFLAAVMGVAIAAVPVAMTYLVKIKKLHIPEAERTQKRDEEA